MTASVQGTREEEMPRQAEVDCLLKNDIKYGDGE